MNAWMMRMHSVGLWQQAKESTKSSPDPVLLKKFLLRKERAVNQMPLSLEIERLYLCW